MNSTLAQSPLRGEKAEEQMLGSNSPISHVSFVDVRGAWDDCVSNLTVPGLWLKKN